MKKKAKLPMASGGDMMNYSFEVKSKKISDRLKIPIGCGAVIALCGSLLQMTKNMDFTAVQLYVNAFIKFFSK